MASNDGDPAGRSDVPALLDCTGPAGVTAAAVEQAQAAWAEHLGVQVVEEDEVEPGLMMAFVLVPPGIFLMGSAEEEQGRSAEEVQHQVTLTQPFYLGKYEVTQAQYQTLAGTNPNWFSAQGHGRVQVAGVDTRRFPVEMVSWDEASGYADSLTGRCASGLKYRLPAEAEWEYACRGGRPPSQPFGVGNGQTLFPSDANFNDHLGATCPVGSYRPNDLGLFDMHGNVWEWCADWYGPYPPGAITNPSGPSGGSSRVVRGGSWHVPARHCRAAFRAMHRPRHQSNVLGFRLARSVSSGGK
jgi:formylglycine-generating enzyme required for sulfatase activity